MGIRLHNQHLNVIHGQEFRANNAGDSSQMFGEANLFLNVGIAEM
jgi:hypothetical protein